MADEKRGPGRPRKNEVEDERLTTEKPEEGRPQAVGNVEPTVPDYPDFGTNEAVMESMTTDEDDGIPGPKPKGTTEIEILRRYVPFVIVNDVGNAVVRDGEFVKQQNDEGNMTLEAGRIVRLPSKEAALAIKSGSATTTENSFDG